MNKPANKHIKKKRSMPGSGILKLFGGIAVVYFILQAVSTFFNGVEVVSATRITVDDMVTATGYFLRDESVVGGTTSETIEHVVHNGEKVQIGTQLAVEYKDMGALEKSHNVNALGDQITLLQSVAATAQNSDDTAKLDQMISIQIRSAEEKIQSGDLSDAAEVSTQLRQLVLRRGAGGQAPKVLAGKIAQLQKQKSTLQQAIGSQSKTISSPCDGYFCDTVDGYEGLLKASEIDALTAETLQAKLKTPVQSSTKALGKVMKGFEWYFAAVVPSAEAKGFSKGQQVTLRFAQMMSDVPVTVYAVAPSAKTGSTLLVFRGSNMSSELISMRKQVAEIIKGSYTGIKVPKSAIHMKDDRMGVFTLSGNVSHFKPVKPLFEGDTYFVVEQSAPEDNGIVIEDNIIVHARGLEDNKVVMK